MAANVFVQLLSRSMLANEKPRYSVEEQAPAGNWVLMCASDDRGMMERQAAYYRDAHKKTVRFVDEYT